MIMTLRIGELAYPRRVSLDPIDNTNNTQENTQF